MKRIFWVVLAVAVVCMTLILFIVPGRGQQAVAQSSPANSICSVNNIRESVPVVSMNPRNINSRVSSIASAAE